MHGTPVGAFGVAGTFSFYPTKNMHSLEGGMVSTADAEFARTLRLLRKRGANVGELQVVPDDLALERDWLGAGYGHAIPAADRALALFAEREDVALEPVYTAKAVAALLELNRRGDFGAGPVLYWHTYSPPQDE